MTRLKALQVTSNYPTPRYPIFGIFMKEQAESLGPLGIDNDIFYSNGKENGGAKQHLKSIFKMMPKIFTRKYDIIHCHHAVSGLILVLSGAALFHKCILSYQNDPDHEYGKWAYRLMYPFFNRIIIKNKPSKYLNDKKTIYLPNGCNSDFFAPMPMSEARKELGWEDGKRYILYMDSNKGKRLQKRKDRYDEVLARLREKHGYDIVSIELSNTPREEIPTIMNACDLHLMTSDFEGSPNSVKECVCCNTPVVCTPVGNVKDMIGDINGCIVTDGFTVDELVIACDKVLKTGKGNFNGRQAFLAKGYGIEAVAQELNRIYHDVTKK